MKVEKYLLDTHALMFWVTKEEVSSDFIAFFDRQSQKGNVYVSSASIWEIALLKKKKRIVIDDIHRWKNDLLAQSSIKMIDPTAEDMIDSTLLPDHHKDPFDRLLIAQAINQDALFVTRSKIIPKYPGEIFWI
ncbi:MAG: type II toxin-antitoxin system VapC family toxin [bacterium]|nr:type II toxin-antitoxin system VapC family toxin [bacterium]